MDLKEENRILKLKLADAEVEKHKLQEELNTVIELYQQLAQRGNNND